MITLTELCAVGALVTTIVLLLLQLGRRSAGWGRKNTDARPMPSEVLDHTRRLGLLEEQVQSLREVRTAARLSALESSSVRDSLCNERHRGLANELQTLTSRLERIDDH